MTKSGRTTLGFLAVISVVLVLVVGNWNTLAMRVLDAWTTQTERSTTTLFRWGELMSISAELKEEYGVEPETVYENEAGTRILGIAFSDDPLSGDSTSEQHAREIAVFAVGATKKFEQIDVVTVELLDSAEEGGELDGLHGPYSFFLEELGISGPR